VRTQWPLRARSYAAYFASPKPIGDRRSSWFITGLFLSAMNIVNAAGGHYRGSSTRSFVLLAPWRLF